MAEKAEKKPEAAPHPPADKKEGAEKKAGGGLMSKTPVVMGLVMVLEAVVLFAGFKFVGGGAKPAVAVELVAEKDEGHGGGGNDGGHGGGGHDAPAGGGAKITDKKKTVEINVLDFKAPNNMNGRRFVYDVSIFAAIKGENEAKVKESLKDQEARVKDRIRTIIAQMDPEKLGGGSEPGLETLRRQVKSQLELIIGDDMISEVLIPRCIPFRADF